MREIDDLFLRDYQQSTHLGRLSLATAQTLFKTNQLALSTIVLSPDSMSISRGENKRANADKRSKSKSKVTF